MYCGMAGNRVRRFPYSSAFKITICDTGYYVNSRARRAAYEGRDGGQESSALPLLLCVQDHDL